MLYSISAAASRGCRRYMEDRVVIELMRDENKEIDGIFVAVLDGHGGPEASSYVKEHLWPILQSTPGFESTDSEAVLKAMKATFLQIHEEMKDVHVSWPSRANGFPSTAGTTVSCALIRHGKIYTAHCGDSRIVLVRETSMGFSHTDLTADHKPEDHKELARIERDGGSVSRVSLVPRVMWVRRHSDRTESVPFLSIARSLGDYWSFVPTTMKYAVSPEPDLDVRPLTSKDKYLVLITDGITHVIKSAQIADHMWEAHPGVRNNRVRNPARYLLQKTIAGWRNLKSDNMSILCIGFHSTARDPYAPLQPTKEFSVDVKLSLEQHLTASPRSIALVSNLSQRFVDPELDSLSIKVNSEDYTQKFRGPGFADQSESDEEEEETDEDQDEHLDRPLYVYERHSIRVEREVNANGEEFDSIDEFDEEIVRSLEAAGPNAANQPVRVLNVHAERRHYLMNGSLNGEVNEKTVETKTLTKLDFETSDEVDPDVEKRVRTPDRSLIFDVDEKETSILEESGIDKEESLVDEEKLSKKNRKRPSSAMASDNNIQLKVKRCSDGN
ncbi:unnamed protein product [Bursaphelenchus xylophilus]|uniref:(pine wood nematode) hypothetical protein n=1 Tax=Bursaphelenchus xylophilus TaxID=6326 RepID=A0A1I7RZS7_BURXY|nr:unnamed protein product [Bursaphelenchus xylophilus]CAG9111728.1 unnamed protein product [Bursaphelenchus xylophilus]